MITVRDIQEALSKSGRVQQDYTVTLLDRQQPVKNQADKAGKPVKKQVVEVAKTLSRVQFVKLNGKRRVACYEISLKRAYNLIKGYIDEPGRIFDEQLEYIPCYKHGGAVEFIWEQPAQDERKVKTLDVKISVPNRPIHKVSTTKDSSLLGTVKCLDMLYRQQRANMKARANA